jgi:long-chain acyl-CoA synthetase
MSVERPWLEHYPAGMPAEIEPDTYPSVVSIVEHAIGKFRTRQAFSNMGRVITYGELDALSQAFASYLLNGLKLKKGDRVALMMPNTLAYPVALFGTLRAGLTVVNVNPLYTPRELKHQLNDAGASVLVVFESVAHTAAEILAETPVKTVVTTCLGDLMGFPKSLIVNFVMRHVKKLVPEYRIEGAVSLGDALRQNAGQSLPKVEIRPDDIAFLQYTGGTTGVAKGAMLLHRNMVANMMQAQAAVASKAVPGQEVVITALPLYHIFALTVNCLVFMELGGLNVLVTNPRDMPAFVKLLRATPFTAITGVNTLFNGLLNTPGFSEVDFSRLKITVGGGMAVQRAVAERWKQVTGMPVVEGYGLTETAPCVTMNPVNATEFTGSIGQPLPSTRISIQDDEGRHLGLGDVGELCVIGPQVMKGYWQRPEESAKVFDADGWLHTGDIARIDERGFVYIVDRKKDMILVSGFNVYPNEVEDVIATMPGVLEVAAVGVPDEKSGEAVKVVIVRKDESLTADQVKAFCRENLTGYKQPRFVEFRKELPKSNVGKILRRELRDNPKPAA